MEAKPTAADTAPRPIAPKPATRRMLSGGLSLMGTMVRFTSVGAPVGATTTCVSMSA